MNAAKIKDQPSIPLSTVRVIEVVTPNEQEVDDGHEIVDAGRALALHQSLYWSLENDTKATLQDPVELADMVSTLSYHMKSLTVGDDPTDEDRWMAAATAGATDEERARVVAVCIQILLGFLRIAHKTDAELAARFRVEIPEGAR